MMVEQLLQQVRNQPDTVEFDQVIEVIDAHYRFTPTAFYNGEVYNPRGANEGSCKLLAFAQLHQLGELETLALFGRYYRDDVLGHPGGSDHANIRNFLLDGWLGVRFEGEPLHPV